MATKVRITNLRTLKKDIKVHVYGMNKLNKMADRHMHEEVAPKVARIVKKNAQVAMNNLKEIYQNGIGDSQDEVYAIEITDSKGVPHIIRTMWQPLSEKYDDSKWSQNLPGAGVFMLRKGKLGAAMKTLPAVRLNKTTSEVTAEVAGKTRGAKKDIKFRIVVNVAKMPFPFDDLVRRPLILGNKAPQPDWPEKLPKQPSSVAVFLEAGTKRAPARPFVRKMAVKLNELMRSEIYAL